MRIGFSYDLKDDYLKEGFTKEQAAEFDSEATICAVCGAVEAMGHRVERIGNAFALAARLISGERWDLVFNICEGLYGDGRESLVPALLDAYRVPYTFSGPLTHAVTLNKAFAKRFFRDAHLPTSEFMVIEDPAHIGKLNCAYPYFVKAVGEGTGKGITPASKVHNAEELFTQAKKLIQEFRQPVIVEPFLPGREVTVGILGTGKDAFCIGVMEVGFTDKADSDIHSYYNKQHCETAAVYTLAVDGYARRCGEIALAAHRALDVKDACRVDIRADHRGEPQIMEMNTLPGLEPGRSDLILLGEMAGLSHREIVQTIVRSALRRSEM